MRRLLLILSLCFATAAHAVTIRQVAGADDPEACIFRLAYQDGRIIEKSLPGFIVLMPWFEEPIVLRYRGRQYRLICDLPR